MAQNQEAVKRAGLFQRLHQLASLSIRGKIILPYLILTLIVAVVGTYVVTTLVSSSLSERLTNQLIDVGQVVSDTLARREMDHLETARAAAFTTGVAEAIRSGNRQQVTALIQPVAAVQGIECLIVADAQGQALLHVLRQADGTTDVIEEPLDLSGLWMAQKLIAGGDPNALPKRGLVMHRGEQRYYYFTAIPVGLDGQVVGVVVVGTSLETLLAQFKQTSMAHVIIYGEGGQAIGSTFVLPGEPTEEGGTSLETLSIPPEMYAELLSTTGITHFENTDDIAGRPYRIARGPLRVGNDTIGVFAVALTSHFITEMGSTNRNTYALVFAIATAAVIVVGFLISQRITTPIRRLVNISQAVAEGNLDQRTGITSADEIGFLAETFDEMTDRLADRTRALEETLSRLQAILSSIGDGVILETADHSFLPLNTAAKAMLQDLSDNFLLGPLHELSMGNPAEGGATQAAPWLDRRRIEVGKKVITAHAAAVQTKSGEPLGTVIVLRDVTAEAEVERVKDAFVAHVSHELRTPLTAVKGYSELLLIGAIGPLQEEQCHFVKTIRHHTENLVTMINTLLDFSELEAWDRLSLHRYPVQLSELVEETAQEWGERMAEKSLTFEVDAPADVPPVNADPKRLQWVIINLVRNAWQYTPEGGSISVRLYAQDGNVVLDVQDTGIGISKEDQQKLFTRFHRVRQTTDETRGIGLGLYVSKAIVEAHGGEVLVTSEVGVGSTFSIVLPALQGNGDAVSSTT